MPIEFDANGNPKPYRMVDLDIDQFEALFTSIPNQSHRQVLACEFRRYLDDFGRMIDPSSWEQWIGGSFTTTKPFPKDIDVVNLIDALSAERKFHLFRYFLADPVCGGDSPRIYSVDGFVVSVFPATDQRRRITEDWQQVLEKRLGRDSQGRPRGIIRMTHR